MVPDVVPDVVPLGFPGGASGKEPASQCRRCKKHRFDPWVRKIPWRREWQPLQYSCLKNPMNRGAWPSHRVTKNWTWLKWFSTQHIWVSTELFFLKLPPIPYLNGLEEIGGENAKHFKRRISTQKLTEENCNINYMSLQASYDLQPQNDLDPI